jgi:YggT family protein
MIYPLFQLIDTIINLYIWTLLAYVISSWLIAFRIINPYQVLVRHILQALDAIHRPILLPIQRLQYQLMPNMGGLDLSPIVAFLAAQYLIGPVLKHAVLAIFA